MLRTKIVCTIGPASQEPETLSELMKAGMDVARLNFSHGDHQTHAEIIQRIRREAEAVGKPIAIMADLQGPKLRVGIMQEGGVPIADGAEIVLTTNHIIGEPGRIPVQFERLPQVVRTGDRIMIDDGLLELQVASTGDTEVVARVITGGVVNSNKGLNLPRADLSIPAITDKDRDDLRFAIEQGVDWVALSFVRTVDEVMDLKAYIRELSVYGHQTPVIAKIEKPEAISNIEAIIRAADGIMVARGDLGIEISPEAVPMLQKMLIKRCNEYGKPVITATQMLESMERNPRPTRAEASDVANAVLDGSDAIMLSAETAAGKYPIESVRTMVRIGTEVERTQAARTVHQLPAKAGRTFAQAVAHASVETAIDLSAAAIVTPTMSGQTARTVSSFRPPCPIIAVTPSPFTQRELVLYWGVYPLLSRRMGDTDAIINDAVDAAQRAGYVSEGDVVVVTGSSPATGGGVTNLMKVHLIERVLAQGTGIGERRVLGRLRGLESPVPAETRIEPDEIIFAPSTDRSFLPVLARARGLITGEGGPGAHCRLVALELGLPAVVGVGDEGLANLKDGTEVVLDPQRGLVFERPPALWQTPTEA
jgi:pyruvate kinase